MSIDKDRNLLTKQGFHRRVLDYMGEGFVKSKAFQLTQEEFWSKYGDVDCKNFSSFSSYQVAISKMHKDKKQL